jgi:hypothetical protein
VAARNGSGNGLGDVMGMSAEEHRAVGLHSNIPECCVEFFIREILPGVLRWNEWSIEDRVSGKMPEVLREYREKYVRTEGGPEYWPCPECVLTKDGNWNVVHECGDGCPGEILKMMEKGW